MALRRLQISNFRGIRQLDWTITAECICLAGSGDVGKTTILDAIERVLWPIWTISFSDADFYECNSTNPIEIVAHVSPVPAALARDRAYGTYLRGWNTTQNELHDEPQEGDELCISVRLRVDADLEPRWEVSNDRVSEPPGIGHKNRSYFNATRLGNNPDGHFSLGRASALTRLAASTDETKKLLADASRSVRQAMFSPKIDGIDDVLDKIHPAFATLGVSLERDEMNISLDPTHSIAGPSALTLHSDFVPLRSYGVGSRNLIGLGIQSLMLTAGGIVLVDEIEHGLEPHRLRNLLRQLRSLAAGEGEHTDSGQVFFTSHSAVALTELAAPEIHLVRNDQGVATVTPAPAELQGTVRSKPEAFLARGIIVCEGKTEEGICRALDGKWPSHRSQFNQPLAHSGIAVIDGNGIPQGASRAKDLSSLGYPVLLFCDSDKPIDDPSIDDLTVAGVTIVQWADGVATEERIAQDLPWEALSEIFTYIYDVEPSGFLPVLVKELRLNADDYLHPDALLNVPDQTILRETFGRLAKKHNWLKRIDHGIVVGDLVAKYWSAIEYTDLGAKIAAVGDWAYSA